MTREDTTQSSFSAHKSNIGFFSISATARADSMVGSCYPPIPRMPQLELNCTGKVKQPNILSASFDVLLEILVVDMRYMGVL